VTAIHVCDVGSLHLVWRQRRNWCKDVRRWSAENIPTCRNWLILTGCSKVTHSV